MKKIGRAEFRLLVKGHDLGCYDFHPDLVVLYCQLRSMISTDAASADAMRRIEGLPPLYVGELCLPQHKQHRRTKPAECSLACRKVTP